MMRQSGNPIALASTVILLAVYSCADEPPQTYDAAPDALAVPDAAPVPEDASEGLDASRPDAMSPDAALSDATIPDAMLPDSMAPIGACDGPTDWASIAPSLMDYSDLLPPIPSAPLEVTWPSRIPALRLETIEPSTVPDDMAMVGTDCSVGAAWDAERVMVGPVMPDPETPHCRASVRGGAPPFNGILLNNRYPTGRRSVPITGEPAWVRLRYPVPPGHRAVELTYGVAWARLFGSDPARCHPDDQDDTGACIRPSLAAGEDWTDVVPPGIFLLWARAGDCDGWLITGPHEPINDLSYNPTVLFKVDVPPSLAEVSELVVSALVYRQYPGGCEGDVCVPSNAQYSTIRFDRAQLRTQADIVPRRTPARAHPRLFGDQTQFLANDDRFASIPCHPAETAPQGAGWGSVTNLRNLWERNTRGAYTCSSEPAIPLREHRAASNYFDGTASTDWDGNGAMQSMYIVRLTRACHAAGRADCAFTMAEADELARLMISVELGRLETWTWSGWPFEFDLRTLPPMRHWSILLDTFWDDLTLEQRTTIRAEMSPLIDAFIANDDAGHWSLYNGNNWTPVLAEAALMWSVALWHEDARAPDVAERALRVLWLHDGFFQEDGSYREGLLEYSRVSLDSLFIINHLTQMSLGMPVESLPWAQLDAYADWTFAFMAPDGRSVDFSDSWSKRGWNTLANLYALLGDELRGLGRVDPDPCRVYKYFTNRYYDWGFRNPFLVDPAIARDWIRIAGECRDTTSMTPSTEVRAWTDGGWGSVRTRIPGNTTTAAYRSTSHETRFTQADENMVAVSAIPSSFPHTELDFGTIVWVSRGNRLLADMGYGTINSSRRYRAGPTYPFDNNPTGHNTLVIPEAAEPGEPSTNTSQIDDADGTIERLEVSGTALLRLDGSVVYGRDHATLGWLDRFDRWILPIDGGHFLIVDGFHVKSSRPMSAVEEYWYTPALAMPVSGDACSQSLQHVDISRGATGRLDLTARCSALLSGAVAESTGRIHSASVHGGDFVVDPAVRYVNRLGRDEHRGRARFVPTGPVRWDLRAFLLQAGASHASTETASVGTSACGMDRCITVQVGSSTRVLRFAGADGTFSLMSITAP